ncbi:MAG: hypothetical protein LBI03_05130 [Clostridiales bacterium]|nr:hypothetical protein [Clostridiales bacterium]
MQEYVQARSNSKIVYDIISELGPDHNKTYEARVTLGNGKKGYGKGRTKKDAEQNAARDLLDRGGVN